MRGRRRGPMREPSLIALILLACGALLPVVSTVAVNAVPEWWKHHPWFIWLLVIVLGLLAALAQLRQRLSDDLNTQNKINNLSDEQLRRAEQELAKAVSDQWGLEVETRSLRRPEPLRVRWSSTCRPVAADASVVLGKNAVPGRALRLKLHGDLFDLVRTFRLLPARQLVVLGEPGGGKTVLAILFTLGLLNDLKPDDPIPVLLPLSSWDPQHEHLYTWLARKLVEEYPGLANVVSYGPDAATRLVAGGRVLPVLDGLDEVPPALHAAAIEALDQAISVGRPVVVTSRSTEYEKAVLYGGTALATAAVIEIEPVELDDAITFLTTNRPLAQAHWQPVVEHLRLHQDGPLAQALSTPLMVDLARTAYTSPATHPAELNDATRFPDRASIEEHLLDAFLPAIYGQRPQRPLPALTTQPATLRRYYPDQAQRWLAFLARHLEHTHTRDFAWWQLVSSIPWYTRGLVFGLPPALLFAVTGELAAGRTIGLVYGLAAALSGCIANGLGERSGPVRVEVRFRGTGVRFLSRFLIGLAIGVALGLGWSLTAGRIVVLVVIFGFALGLHVWLDTPADANQVSSPSIVLKQDRLATLPFAVSLALSLGLFYGMADAFTESIRFIPVLDGAFDLALALAAGLAGAVLGRFIFGHIGSLAYGAAGAIIGGLVFPPGHNFLGGLTVGAVFGLGIGLWMLLSRAWGAFILSRGWLALMGHTPLRLMRFLDDAHRRGVLRQAGAVYQFRHARLQDCLLTRIQE